MNIDERVARRYLSTQDSARSRGLDFNLSLTSIRNLLNSKRCYYTGIPLTFEVNEPNQLTLDRVDNTKGYVKGNVVACSLAFNAKKKDLTIEDINILYKTVGEKV